MDEYGASTYGDRWAETYDAWASHRFSEQVTTAAVDVLADLAGTGKALELGIGTGRVALPLSKRGVEVHGIDASEKMLGKLAEKPGAEAVTVTLGDFSAATFPEQFQLIYVVFNTLFSLMTQEEQVRCFQTVADHLEPTGVFLVEAFVPDLTRFDSNQTVRMLDISLDHAVLEASRHNPVTQVVESQHLSIWQHATQMLPIRLRYAWPSELDLMARLAGLQLQQRWNDWDRSPFTVASTNHISLYGLQG
jgi:SAM-dependent methyltransferase